MQFVWALALMVVSYALTAILTPAPKPQQSPTAAFKDFQFPVPDEGAAQAVLFGECWTPDWQVLWYGNLRVEDIPVKTAGGKK